MANEYSSTISCSEERSSYSEQIDLQTWSPSVTLRCAWDDRYNLYNDLNGKPWIGADSGDPNPPRALGFVITGEAEVQPPVLGRQDYQYQFALLKITYQRVQKSTGGNSSIFDFYTESIEPTIEQLRVPHQRVFFQNAGSTRALEPDEAPTFPLYRERFKRTYFGMNVPLDSAFTSLQGNINNAAYTSSLLGLTYPARSILYGNRSIQTSVKTDGSQSTNMTLNFTYRQETWRKFWDWESNAFVSMIDGDGNAVAYPPEANLGPVLL